MIITRLFEIFDPLISVLHINNYILLIVLTTPLFLWKTIKRSRTKKITSNLKNYIYSELGAALSNNNKTPILVTLFSIFILILILNLRRLIPYVYTLTRQIIFTLSLALPAWLAIVLFRIFKNTTHFISHLVPLSTPIALSHFITIIESIRLLIRPITLSVRLCANITAGHILIALIRNTILIINPIRLALVILIILEFAVAFIQRYVFTMLLSIYLREVE